MFLCLFFGSLSAFTFHDFQLDPHLSGITSFLLTDGGCSHLSAETFDRSFLATKQLSVHSHLSIFREHYVFASVVYDILNYCANKDLSGCIKQEVWTWTCLTRLGCTFIFWRRAGQMTGPKVKGCESKSQNILLKCL